jgi:hypothetical protein
MADKNQQPWKMPPLIKVYEALGAVGDDRVRLLDERRAAVVSSEGDKTYAVEIEDNAVSSNDNASYWQGYLGYPAIAVLIARGPLAAPAEASRMLANIPWKEINRRYRNDYARTIAEVDEILRRRDADPALIKRMCEEVLTALAALEPKRGPRRPPPRAQ